MPGSVRENDIDVINFVKENEIKQVIDVGAGRGTYSDLLREHVDNIDGIEVWEPYIKEFGLVYKYCNLYEGDAREFSADDLGKYDISIFGDVLEHMSAEDSVALWNEHKKVSKFGLVSVPIIHYPQGAEFGNPYEVHVQDHLTPDKVRELFGPFEFEEVYEITGTFIARF